MLRGTETDEQLMALYQEGSEEAFAVLYSRHSGKILGYLKSRLRSEQEVADLFQEVFVKIHRSKHLYKRSLPVLPWIFSVTHSVLIDGVRKRNRKKEDYDFNFDQMPSQENEEAVTVVPLLNVLANDQQLALQMRYLDEKTFEEIAISLKTSTVNARQIISRGVKKIKRLITVGDKS